MRPRPSFVVILVLFAVAVSLGAAELMLRWRGAMPWLQLPKPPNQPVLASEDPVLVWDNKPGRHVFPGYSPEVKEVTITVEPDGSRSAGPTPSRPKARVALLGDSIAFGWAISDDETFAWKLQARFPDVAFVNHGVSGYGTYQSFLKMRRLMAEDPPPDLILYGFYHDHLQRNVQSLQWVDMHDRNDRPSTAPYCTTDADGHLLEHPGEPISRWPLRRSLASVYFVEQLLTRRRVAKRSAYAWPVMQSLAVEMDRIARARGSRFVLLFLMSRPGVSRPLTEFLRSHDIAFLDCNRVLRPQWMVKGEGHPNGAMNDEWADCVAAALPGLLAERGGAR